MIFAGLFNMTLYPSERPCHLKSVFVLNVLFLVFDGRGKNILKTYKL